MATCVDGIDGDRACQAVDGDKPSFALMGAYELLMRQIRDAVEIACCCEQRPAGSTVETSLMGRKLCLSCQGSAEPDPASPAHQTL